LLGGPQIKSAADYKLAESILQYVFPVRVGHFLRPQILGRIAAAQLDRAKVVNDVFRVVRNAVFRVDLGLEFGGDVSNSSRITGLGNVCTVTSLNTSPGVRFGSGKSAACGCSIAVSCGCDSHA